MEFFAKIDHLFNKLFRNYDDRVKIIEDRSVSAQSIQNRKKVSNNNREWHAKALRDIASSLYFQPWLNSEECSWIGFGDIAINFIFGQPENDFQVLNNSVVSLTTINVLPLASKNGKFKNV